MLKRNNLILWKHGETVHLLGILFLQKMFMHLFKLIVFILQITWSKAIKVKSYSLKSCLSSDCDGDTLSGAMLIEDLVSVLNVNYLQKYPVPFVICPSPEIIKFCKSAELCKVTPSPCLSWKIQISTSQSSGLALGSGCSLPVVHLLYSFLNLGHDLQNKFLQAVILHAFIIEFTFIQITICLFLFTSFQFKVCPFSSSFVVLGCFGGWHDNQVSQIRGYHATILQGALFCSGDILDYIVLHVARSWLETMGVQSEQPVKPLYPMSIWSGWETENIRNTAPLNQSFPSSSGHDWQWESTKSTVVTFPGTWVGKRDGQEL